MPTFLGKDKRFFVKVFFHSISCQKKIKFLSLVISDPPFLRKRQNATVDFKIRKVMFDLRTFLPNKENKDKKMLFGNMITNVLLQV